MLDKLMKQLESKQKRKTSKHKNQSVRLDRFMWEADDLKIVSPKENPNNNPIKESEENQ